MRRDVFQAIADPVRREIIDLLAKDQMSVNSVAQNFKISRPAISKHLKILHECGLVSLSQKGKERLYQVEAKKLSEVSSWVERYRPLWENRLDSFEEYLYKIKAQRRED